MKVNRIRHIGLKVKDLDVSLNFYRNKGFIVIFRGREYWGKVKLEIAKLGLPGGDAVLELIQAEAWPGNHFAVEVDQIPFPSALVNPLIKESVTYIQDPDGHYIELVRLKGDK